MAAFTVEEPIDCKCSAVHRGSRRYTDGLHLSPLIYVEWSAITAMISGRIQMHDI